MMGTQLVLGLDKPVINNYRINPRQSLLAPHTALSLLQVRPEGASAHAVTMELIVVINDVAKVLQNDKWKDNKPLPSLQLMVSPPALTLSTSWYFFSASPRSPIRW